jgi:dipeptidyl-peptidase-3
VSFVCREACRTALTDTLPAVADFLQKLHVYKSTADVEAGSKFFTDMSSVGLEYWGTKVRDVVLKNKQPRKVFVQANTFLDEATGAVSIKQYEPSLEGIIQSWAERGV